MSLNGKTMFISGASRGIGLAIAKRAAQDGANIALIAKTAEPHPKLPGTIHTAAEEIEKAGGRALACLVDVRFEDQIRSAVVQAVAAFGGIDVLVSAAGLAPRAVAIAGQLDHPVYDCLYLALAEAEQAGLVTADLRFLGKVRTTAWEPRAISLSEYRSAGVRPAYGQDTSGPR